MNTTSFLVATSIAAIFATPGLAAPIDLDFSFAGRSGTFFGLDNADGISSAASVTFIGGFDSYTFDAATAISNQFTFLGGILTDMAFSDGISHPGSGGIAVLTNFDCLFDNCTTAEQTVAFGAFFDVPGSFPVFTSRPVAAVPLPAGGLLLLSGFFGLAGLRRRKKQEISD